MNCIAPVPEGAMRRPTKPKASMDQLAALRALRRVVELGSFTAAAAALDISHTVVSRQIRQLEEQLGAQLLNRTTRRFALTAAGKEYYDASRQILDSLDAADRAVGQHHARPSGSLRINAPMAFGTLELATWLPDFLALRLTRDLPDSTLVARRLASSALVTVAAPAYLARHGTPHTPADLLRHNCLVYTQAAKPNDWSYTNADGARDSVTVKGTRQANTGVALRAAALAGLGSVSTASFIVHEELKRGALVRVLPGYAMRPRELYALYPQSRHLSPKVRALVDFAAALYQARDWG